MSYYGNILTLVQATPVQQQQVATVLTAHNCVYQQVDQTFYLETRSIAHTQQVAREVEGLGVPFAFFHNRVSKGSFCYPVGLPDDVREKIHQILFVDPA
ncbi:MAG: hypothetical protein ACK5V5_12800 [Cyclobacteriaceae bacterium]|jgi:hypothetical protein|nr:hypothetical protein [Flammeovirgaceae bacterium]